MFLMTARAGLRLAATAGLMLLCSVLLLAACGSEDGTVPEQPAGTATGVSTAVTGLPTARVATATAEADTPAPEVETPTPGAEPRTAEPEPPAGGKAAGTLAEAGQDVFRQECAECHGAEGEGQVGPALIGENTNLPAFGTAEGLYDFVRRGMPLDAPGSLPEQEYLEVLAFLLLANAEVEEDTPLGVEGLDEIDLQ